MGKELVSLDAKMYRGTAGAPAATELKNVRDVTVNVEVGEIDASIRGVNWALVAAGMIKASIDFEMLDKEADADVAAVRAAFFGRSPLAFKILDKASGEGLDADFYILKFSRKEPMEGGIAYDVSIKPTDAGGRNPSWVTP